MATQLATIERQLVSLQPRLSELLPAGSLTAERITRTVLVSIENNRGLERCSMASIMSAATTAAVLGLEVDGVSGQGHLVPFKGRAQFVAGYKGLVTLAARAGRTLEGFVVLEGDEFSFDEPTGRVEHRRQLGGEDKRRAVAFFATSRSNDAPAMLRVLSLDQVLEIRNGSQGFKSGKNSPWSTHFELMGRKSAMIRLSKDIPVLSLQLAAALETQHELGRHAHVRDAGGGVVIDGELEPAEAAAEVAPAAPAPAVAEEGTYYVRTSRGGPKRFLSFEAWHKWVVQTLVKASPAQRKKFAELNADVLGGMMEEHPEELSRVLDLIHEEE